MREDLTGKTFGELTVIRKGISIINKEGFITPTWICQCSCGNKTTVRHYNLTNNKTKSCGCLISKRTKEVCHKTNFYDLSGHIGIGYTTNTNEPFYFDLEDYDKIKDYCWYRDRQYLSTKYMGKSIKMHQLLGYKYYDHIDRNGLNNTKQNLRKCTVKENTWNRSKPSNNTSGVIGVSYHSSSQKWRAYITVDGKQINLGYFQEKEKAIKERLKAEKKYFKEFSPNYTTGGLYET